MSISTQLDRIRADKSKIRNKLVSFGLATSTDNLDKLASAVDGITHHTNIQAEVLEGSTYTIPKGYHNGSGVVIAKTDTEGDYSRYVLQAKTGIIPSDKQQTITSDEGNYGLSSVTVEPIPSNYKDISNVTAESANVLAGKIFVNGDGVEETGTMPNKGAVEVVLDDTKDANGQPISRSYIIPAGYHNGNGIVRLGDTMHDTSDVNASANTVLDGYYFVNSSGQTVEGTIPTNTSADLIANGKTVTVPAGYYPTMTTKDVADNDLVAGNIKTGVNIFGVIGTFTSDATATTSDMLSGKTAYVNGSKVTGNIATKTASNLSASGKTVTVPAGYYASQVTKDVATATREQTIITAEANDGVIKITANNPQASGYVTSDTTKDTAFVEVAQYVNGKTVTAWIGDGDAPIEASVADGAYTASVSLTKGSGSVSATGTNVTLTKASTKPSSGYYITATGSGSVSATGTATIGTAGWLEKGSKTSTSSSATSNTATAYYTIAGATVPTSINPLTQTSVSVTAGYTSGGTISVSGELEAALAEI